MLQDLLVKDAYLYMIVFARLAGALMLLPGFGEFTIPARIRLGFALLLSFVLFPIVSPALPQTPPSGLAGLFMLLASEILIGIVIGTIARLLLSSLQVAGTIIAFNSGLGSAQLFDPTAGQQGAITGAFLSTLGVTMLFVTNMHHMMLVALVDSYTLFVPGAGFPVGDFSDLAAKTVAESFRLGLQIAMPVLIVTMIVYLAMGIMARLMPQLQVFFIALPLQIVIGFSILSITLGAGMMLFLDHFEAVLGGFLRQG